MEQRDGGDFSPKKPTPNSEASSTAPADFPARKVVRQLDRHTNYCTSTAGPAATVREAEPAAKTITPSAARDAFHDEATASAASCTTFSSFHTLPCATYIAFNTRCSSGNLNLQEIGQDKMRMSASGSCP
ncbi:hypothetical protein OROMI_017013 [Orobanche minor]